MDCKIITIVGGKKVFWWGAWIVVDVLKLIEISYNLPK
jgi:hypothetical protein